MAIAGCRCRWRVALAALFPLAVFAQPAEDEAIEEIVVTGSRIARQDFIALSPLTTIDRAALDASGQPTLEETLNQMPQILPDFGRTANNPGDGTARLNLRGLGSNRTLVLLNGRRLAPAGIGSSVDVNTLSQALIERVEIITGGATTVYGSDAVAGVVNFILRDDFEGLGLDAGAYATEAGDSQVYDLNLTWGSGFANGRGHATLFATWLDRRATFAGDRELTRFALADDGAGNLERSGSPTIPGGLVFSPELFRFTPDGVPAPFVIPDDLYNFAPVNYLQVPLTRYSAGTFLDYELGPRMEAYAEFTHTRNLTRLNLAPSPATLPFAETTLNNPAMTPEAQQAFAQFPPSGPDTVVFSFTRRMDELGARILDSTDDYTRLLAGLRGGLGADWEFDVWVTYTRGEEEERLLNDALRSRMLQGLLVDPVTGACRDPSNGCVPLNLFGAGALDAEGVAFLRAPPFENVTHRIQKLVSGYARGPVFELAAGPVEVALGAEWRSDEGSFHADPALFENDSLGYLADSSVVGEESVAEIYGEALVPLVERAPFARSLWLELGARFSEYDKAGSTNAWKFGGAWQPLEALRFRAMWQRSVRAPDLKEAFQEEFLGFTGKFSVGDDPADDLCSASADPIGRGNAAKCIAQGIPEDRLGTWEAMPFYPAEDRLGGNPVLEPETAKTLTLGVVFTGLDNWTIAVDYYELEVSDPISEPNPYAVCFARENTDGLLCDRITRSNDASLDDFNVREIDYTLVNLGETVVEGFDTQVAFTTELPGAFAPGGAYADLSFDLVWTHQGTQSTQEAAVLTPMDCAGRFGHPCDIPSGQSVTTFPENRITAAVRYAAGDFDTRLSWRWIEGTKNAAPLFAAAAGLPAPELAIERVSDRNYFDVSAGYRFNENVAARLQVSNLFDTDPPVMADAVNSNNTDTRLYDIFGRSYRLSFSLRY